VPWANKRCWNERRCPRKRSHYLNREENNAKQRGTYAQKKASKTEVQVGDSLFIPVEAPPVAYLYLYKKNRKDAPLHAIEIALWQGATRIQDVEPVHCDGLQNRHVNAYLQNALTILNEKFGIKYFIETEPLDPERCPIPNCPKKHRRQLSAN
jgi:hypothetical protein